MSDESAEFRSFFDDLLPTVLRVAQRMTGDRASAEDVAAEAFARAFARWRRVGTLSYREGWVLRVASNLAVDLARRRARVLRTVSTDSADGADSVDLRMTLRPSLARLSRAQRQAVVLRYVADMSENEVAAAMHIRPGTVKSHLHRATQALRTDLGVNLEEVS
ncbi:MAG: sigma-70 family RNA polymerase sigma factor [Mycobacteriales bacterium]